jgi:Stage II sporulation protein E (SpoIIE)
MTSAALAGTGVPLLQQLFPQVPLIEQVHRTPTLIFGVLEECLAAAFLALWRAARDYRVFRTLGFFYLVVGNEQFLQYFGGYTPPVWSGRALAVALLVEAAGEAMQVPRRGWTRLFWPLYLFAGIATWFPSMAWVNDLPALFSEVALGALTVQGFQRGNRRDRLVAAAFTVHLIVRLTISSNFQHLTGMKNYFAVGGWQWQYTTCGITALGAVTLAILVRDLIHDRAEKQRLAAELAASRAVQQVLIPEEGPEIPGFKISSVYEPYGEVGGDFYQILPLPDHGVLIAIGDVSGKGMPAAMMVSLLVGTLHALIETTTSPGRLLAGLNRLVQGRSHDGFTTCLILRISAHGAVTFANAGHILPYRNGIELECEGGLPLGLVGGTAYAETSFELNAGEQLTLVTDGVVEARDDAGKLFGFERTARLASNTAEAIVQAAQAFGQEDDITVLTVRSVAACG